MDPSRVYLFCSLTQSVFVEQGSVQGHPGYWFIGHQHGRRRFVTEGEVEAELRRGSDRRVATRSIQIPAPTLAVAS